MKITPEQFEQSKTEFIRWQKLLGLMDWRVCFEHGKADIRAYATINADLEGRIATVIFEAEVDEKDGSMIGFDPANTGRHEALELLAAELKSLARYRYVRPDEIDAAAHGVIRRLENLFDHVKEIDL